MKTCKKCGKTIPESMRLIAIFCSSNCRKLHSKHTAIKRQNEALNKLGFDSIGDLVEWVENSPEWYWGWIEFMKVYKNEDDYLWDMK